MCTGTYHGNWLRLGAKTPFAQVRKSSDTVSFIARSTRMSLHAATNTIGHGGQRASQQEKPLQATQLDGPFSFTGSAVHINHTADRASPVNSFRARAGKKRGRHGHMDFKNARSHVIHLLAVLLCYDSICVYCHVFFCFLLSKFTVVACLLCTSWLVVPSFELDALLFLVSCTKMVPEPR